MKWLANYLSRHVQALRQAFLQISRAPLASVMTCLVIGIALALPSLLYVALKNLQTVNTHLQDTLQITLFLKPSVKAPEAMKLADKISHDTNVLTVQNISPEIAFKELQEEMGMSGSTRFALPKNPLPWTIIVSPKTPQIMETLATTLKNLPQVDLVQIDEQWSQRLTSILSFIKRFFISIAVFLGLAIFLIINNVIRSATQQNQKEIEVIKLIGGTAAFIRRPFLYSGMLYGLLGTIVAWQLVDILMLVLKKPLSQLTSLYESTFYFQGLSGYNTLILLGFGLLLGLSASWFAVSRQLKNL